MTVGVLISGLQHERGRVAQSPSAAGFFLYSGCSRYVASVPQQRVPNTHRRMSRLGKVCVFFFLFFLGSKGVLSLEGGGGLPLLQSRLCFMNYPDDK